MTSASTRLRTSIAILALCLLPGATISAETAPAETTPVDAFDPVGDWLGSLEFGGSTLRLLFHINRTDEGLSATIDSLDQGADGIPVSRITFENGKLVAEIKAIGGTYRGEAQEDGTFHGTWSQGGMSLPLDLKPQTEEIAWNRPQEPKEPFPYRSEDVTFENSDDGVTLAGTLTLPNGQGPFAAAILISGSGPQDRDESLMGHRPFLVLADHLTRQGLAVLRYDDRGTAESTGDFEAATSEDFARDTLAAVRFLVARNDIGAIGLVGHSEGGLIAPMVATQDDRVDYVVLLAGPGTPGRRIMLDQTERLYAGRGVDDFRVKKNRRLQKELFDHILADADAETLRKSIGALIDFQSGGALSAEDRDVQIEAQAKQLTTPWFRFFLAHDPAPVLAEVKQPVLALVGAKDFQVPADTNLTAVAEALKSGGNQDFETAEMEGLNHLFQTAETGLVDEYSKIEETFAPAALERISGWILSKTQPSTP